MSAEEKKIEEKLDDEEDSNKPPFKSSHPFYNPVGSQKKRTWKSLKQILAAEKMLKWPENVPLYSNVNAPPSMKPAEKFSDLSGLPALYTDPATRLRYANKEEYATLQTLPMDITSGYLALRGASSIVG